MDNFELESLLPMPPNMGPPFPVAFQIFWPWYKEVEVITPPEVPPPLPYSCPYCDQSFNTLKELIDHAAATHPDQPPIGEITIEWGD